MWGFDEESWFVSKTYLIGFSECLKSRLGQGTHKRPTAWFSHPSWRICKAGIDIAILRDRNPQNLLYGLGTSSMKYRLTLVVALLLALPTFALAQDSEAGDAKKDDRKIHTVKPGFFEVIESVNATVESKNMTPVEVNVEKWTDLEIKKILDEGSVVSAGEPIVWFETDEIDRKLKDASYAIQMSELGLKSSELELDLAEKTFDLNMQLKQRDFDNMQEDYKYYTEVERPNQERSTQRGVQNSQHSLEYAQEEYNQLKRMYDEDELTEESEEIVLKRTQRDVENQQYYLEQRQIQAARTLETVLPREAEVKKTDLERSRLEFEKSKVAMPMERTQKRIAFEKATTAFQNEMADFKQLEADRKQMTVTAPVGGVLYFGSCQRGKWIGASGSPVRDLQPGKKAAPNKTLVTIVDPAQVMLRANLTEKQLASITVGADGVATPTAFPKSQTKAQVTKINYVPQQSNTFDCQMAVTEIPTGVMPGMTCSVRFVLAQKENALTVPEAAVFTMDGINHYVYLVDGDSHRKHAVTVGLKSGGNYEITGGLSADDKILSERPE